MTNVKAVMEFIKRGRGPNFTEADIETVNSYLVWGAVGLHYANQFARLGFEYFLKSLFRIIVSYSGFIIRSLLTTFC